MKSSVVTLCSTLLVLLAMLRLGGCFDAKPMPLVERLYDSLDILQEDSQVESLAPVSPNSELFEIAKRLAQKHESPVQGRHASSDGSLFGRKNNMDLLEENSEEFMDLSVDIAYSAIYLLSNYTRFVQNANNKFIVVFE